MFDNKKYVYEIVEKNEADPLQDKVRKSNIDVEFTMQELDFQQDNILKYLDEIRGKLNIEAAKMSNVEDNHKDAVALVSQLSPVKQEAIRIWLNSKSLVDQLGPKKEEGEKALEQHKEEVAHIIKVTGWEPPKKDANEDTTKEGDTKEDTKEEASGDDSEK